MASSDTANPLVCVLGDTAVNEVVGTALRTCNESSGFTRIRFETFPLSHANAFPAAERSHDSEYATYTPQHILKSNWMRKHDELLPGLAVLVFDFDGGTTEAAWSDALGYYATAIRSVRDSLRGRRVDLHIVLVVESTICVQGESHERLEYLSERVMAMRRAATLESKSVTLLNTPDITSSASMLLPQLEQSLRERVLTSYRLQTRRIKGFRPTLTQVPGHLPLITRHEIKIAHYNELCGVPAKALKHHQTAYQTLVQIPVTQDRLPELRAVGSMLCTKIWRALLAQGQLLAAVAQFQTHVNHFRDCGRIDNPAFGFLHYQWLQDEYTRFGNAVSGFPPQDSVHPATYFQCAASCVSKRRAAAEAAGVLTTAGAGGGGGGGGGDDDLSTPPVILAPPYVGQLPEVPIVDESLASLDPDSQTAGKVKALQRVFAQRERETDYSTLILEHLERSFDLKGGAAMAGPRATAMHKVAVATELNRQNRVHEALNNLHTAVVIYRKEGWWPLLSAAASMALQCCERMGDVAAYVQYSLLLLSPVLLSSSDSRMSIQTRMEAALQAPQVFFDTAAATGVHPPSLPTSPLVYRVPPSRDLPLVSASATFNRRVAHYGESVELVVSLTSTFPEPITFGEVELTFDPPVFRRRLVHAPGDASGDGVDLTLPPLSSVSYPITLQLPAAPDPPSDPSEVHVQCARVRLFFGDHDALEAGTAAVTNDVTSGDGDDGGDDGGDGDGGNDGGDGDAKDDKSKKDPGDGKAAAPTGGAGATAAPDAATAADSDRMNLPFSAPDGSLGLFIDVTPEGVSVPGLPFVEKMARKPLGLTPAVAKKDGKKKKKKKKDKDDEAGLEDVTLEGDTESKSASDSKLQPRDDLVLPLPPTDDRDAQPSDDATVCHNVLSIVPTPPHVAVKLEHDERLVVFSPHELRFVIQNGKEHLLGGSLTFQASRLVTDGGAGAGAGAGAGTSGTPSIDPTDLNASTTLGLPPSVPFPAMAPYATQVVSVEIRCREAASYRVVARATLAATDSQQDDPSVSWQDALQVNPHFAREVSASTALHVAVPLRCVFRLLLPHPVIVSSIITRPEDGALHVGASEAPVMGRVSLGDPFLVLMTLSSMSTHPIQVHDVLVSPAPGTELLTSTGDIQEMLEDGRAVLLPEDKFSVLLQLRCTEVAPAAALGKLQVVWSRLKDAAQVEDDPTTTHSFDVRPAGVRVESNAITCKLTTPSTAVVGTPTSMSCVLKNNTSRMQSVTVNLTPGDGFLVSGYRKRHVMLLPHVNTTMTFSIVPCRTGYAQAPTLSVVSELSTVPLLPAVNRSPLFVYPARDDH